MKFIIGLAFFAGLVMPGCCSDRHNGQQAGSSPHFILLSAVKETWSAPRPGGVKRDEYFFTIKTTTADKLLFDSAWLPGNAYSLFVIKKDAPVSNEPLTYGNGDTLIVRISAQHEQGSQSPPPFSFTGDALLRYQVNKAQQYFIVPKINKQSTPNNQ